MTSGTEIYQVGHLDSTLKKVPYDNGNTWNTPIIQYCPQDLPLLCNISDEAWGLILLKVYMNKNELLQKINELDYTKKRWTATSNAPFYAQIDKPAPSLSKYDERSSSYWRIEDVELVLLLVNNIDLIKEALNETFSNK